MPAPVVSFIGGLVAKGIGGLLGASGASQEAEAYAQAAEYNADVAIENGYKVVRQYNELARKERVMGKKQLGAIRAAYGASGVTSENSVSDVLENSAANSEANANAFRDAGVEKQNDYSKDARMKRKQAASYRNGGSTKAASILIGTGASMLGDFKGGGSNYMLGED